MRNKRRTIPLQQYSSTSTTNRDGLHGERDDGHAVTVDPQLVLSTLQVRSLSCHMSCHHLQHFDLSFCGV
jgi:hypothetical protein